MTTINAELAEPAETLAAAPQSGVAGPSDRERTISDLTNRSFAIRRAAPIGLRGRPTASSVWQPVRTDGITRCFSAISAVSALPVVFRRYRFSKDTPPSSP